MMRPPIPDEAAIAIHLANLREFDGIIYASGFILALRDARHFTKRNQDTGTKLLEAVCGNHGSWLGTIGYLALLDQIGGCFKPKGVTKIEDVSIVRALRYFTTLTIEQSLAIYALRCAFAHDYSLININKNKPMLTHIFTVSQGTTDPVVKLANKQWNGSIENFTDDNITHVNLETLGDTVEEVYQKLIELRNTNRLEIVLKGGAEELLRRYSISIPKPRY